jgi:hypothetical protein
MIYSRNKPPKRWPQNENAPYHHDAIGGTEKLTNTSADFTGSRAQHGNIFAPMPGKRAPNFGLVLVCCAGACAGNFSRTPKSRGTVRSGAENTQQTAEILPDSEAFSRPKFTVASLAARGYGLDGRSGNARRTTVCVFSHPAHPLCLKSAESGFQQFKQELETMFASKGQTAPTLKAAPAIIPSSTTDSASETQAFALLEATSSASLAAFYLRRGDVKAARRKAVLLLKSLQVLEVAHDA